MQASSWASLWHIELDGTSDLLHLHLHRPIASLDPTRHTSEHSHRLSYSNDSVRLEVLLKPLAPHELIHFLPALTSIRSSMRGSCRTRAESCCMIRVWPHLLRSERHQTACASTLERVARPDQQ